MAFVVLSIITVLILFVVLGLYNHGKNWKLRPRQVLAVFGCFWLLFGIFAIVPTGHTGILTTFGRVEDTTLESGLHFKSPIQEVIVMDNRTQKQVLNLNCFSSDIQEVEISYSINYQIEKKNAQKIYKVIGSDYYNVVMAPRIQEAVKSVISKYTAESLIENRDNLSSQITEILIRDLGAYNIEVVNTAIEDLDFSDAFTTAVENKQVAQQNKLRAETEQAQKTMEEEAAAARQLIAAEAEAKVAKIQAEADKDVLQIQADAAEYAGKKDAAVNEALATSLDETLLRYYTIKQWNGELPEYLAGMSDSDILALIYGLKNQEVNP